MESVMKVLKFGIVALAVYMVICTLSQIWLLADETLVIVDKKFCSISQDIALREILEDQGLHCSFTFGGHNPFILGIPIWKPICFFNWEHEDGVLMITTK